MGNVRVAGIHRLIARLDLIHCIHVLVIGMEGALAGVVGGLVEQPQLALPTRGVVSPIVMMLYLPTCNSR